jgi:5'-nucleotidase / UDP-sugar diphosphatase
MDLDTAFTSYRFSSRTRLKFFFLSIFLLFFSSILPLIWRDKESSCKAENDVEEKLPFGEKGSDIEKITFVHISDIHARYNPDKDGSSPVGRIRGYYNRVKKESPFTLFTNAGDDYEKGSVAEELSFGQATREVVQAMQYDVRILGNHDFAWGIEELLRFSHDPASAVIATNTRIRPESGKISRHPTPGWTDFTIRTVGRVRVGFFGLTSRPWDEQDHPYSGQYYPDIQELYTDFDYIGIAEDIIARYRKDVDLLVLISHLGQTDDRLLAEKTNGIDLILGGHCHTKLDKPLRVNKTTIIHVGAFAEYIGRFDIEYNVRQKAVVGSSFQLIPNRCGDIPEDQITASRISEILKKYEDVMHETVSRVSEDQDSQAMAAIAARAAVSTLKVDAAIISRGTVGQEWRRGNLTRQDILNSFMVERQPSGTPGQSSLYVITVRGTDLHAATALGDSVYHGPVRIHPAALYTLAIHKPQAFNQQENFGRIIGISAPRPAGEIWEVIVAHAQERKSAGFSLDERSYGRKAGDTVALLQRRG